MKKIKIWVFFLIIVNILNSCSLLHKNRLINKEEEKEISLKKQVIKSYIQTNNFKAKYYAQIYIDEQRQKVNGIISITDTLAKITAISGFGLPLAKITMEQNSIHISSMLFENIHTDSKTLLNTTSLTLTPRIIKDLFIDNYISMIDTITIMNYSIEKITDTSITLLYRCTDIKQPKLATYANQITFSLAQNKITENKIWDFISDNAIYIKYKDFHYIDKKKIPKKIEIKIVQGVDTSFSASIILKNIRVK